MLAIRSVAPGAPLEIVLVTSGDHRWPLDRVTLKGFVVSVGQEGCGMKDFTAIDQNGQPWRLSEALGRGAVVLVFYRGDW